MKISSQNMEEVYKISELPINIYMKKSTEINYKINFCIVLQQEASFISLKKLRMLAKFCLNNFKYVMNKFPKKFAYFSLSFSFSSQKSNISHLINPYTKQVVSDKTYLTQSQIMEKTSLISKNQKQWKTIKLQQRIKIVKKFVQLIIKDRQVLRQKIANQIGKSYNDIDSQLDELLKVAPLLIDSARQALLKKDIFIDEKCSRLIQYEPVGLTVLFPYFSQPIFDSIVNLIPCLISGSSALIKGSDFNHFLGQYLAQKIKQASKMQLIADLFLEPENLHLLCKFRSIKKVVFSGSQPSAKHIFQTIVKNRFIDCNLFFGGQDAAYVDETSDLQNTASQIINSSFANNGQSYDCIKRVYIHQSVKEKMINLLKQKISKILLSSPSDKLSNLGPLAIPQTSSKLEALVSQAVTEGAQCQIGGMIYSDGNSQGIFFEPTLLSQCTNDMSIMQTQTLGPILCCCTVSSDQQFATLVNQNKYGSGVRIFTKQSNSSNHKQILQRYQKIIQKIDVGKICFNKGTLFTSNAPIQGWKSSGKGKILSQMSYQQFTLPKSYNIVNQI